MKNIQNIGKIQHMKNAQCLRKCFYQVIIFGNIFRGDTCHGDKYFFNPKNSYKAFISYKSPDHILAKNGSGTATISCYENLKWAPQKLF